MASDLPAIHLNGSGELHAEYPEVEPQQPSQPARVLQPPLHPEVQGPARGNALFFIVRGLPVMMIFA